MQTRSTVTVKAIAFLDAHLKELGRPSTAELEVPETGESARALAVRMGLPLAGVEGVFHNHSAAGLDATIMRGDRVAFVPPGTPSSHPAFLGPFITRRRP